MARTKKKVQDQQRIELARYMAIQSGRGRGRGRPRGRGSSSAGSRTSHSASTSSQLTATPVPVSLFIPNMVSGKSLPLIQPSSTGTNSVKPFQQTVSTSTERSPSVAFHGASLKDTKTDNNPPHLQPHTVRSKATARKSTTAAKMKKYSPNKLSKTETSTSCDTFSRKKSRDVGNIFDRMCVGTLEKKHLINQLSILSPVKHRIQVFSNITQALKKLGNDTVPLPLVCLRDVLQSNKPDSSHKNRNSAKTSKGKEYTKSPRPVKCDLKRKMSDLSNKDLKHAVNKTSQSVFVPAVMKTPSASKLLPLPDSPARSEKRKRSPNVRLGSDMILLPWHTTRKPRDKPESGVKHQLINRDKPSHTIIPSPNNDNKATVSSSQAGQKSICKSVLPVNKSPVKLENKNSEQNADDIINTPECTVKRKVDFTISANATCDIDDVTCDIDDVTCDMDDVSSVDTKPCITDITESMQTVSQSNNVRLGEDKTGSRLSSLISKMSARVASAPSSSDGLACESESEEENLVTPKSSPCKNSSPFIPCKETETGEEKTQVSGIKTNNKCTDLIETDIKSREEKSCKPNLMIESCTATKSDKPEIASNLNTDLSVYSGLLDIKKEPCLLSTQHINETTNPSPTLTETTNMTCDSSDSSAVMDIKNKTSIQFSSHSSDCKTSTLHTTEVQSKDGNEHSLCEDMAPTLKEDISHNLIEDTTTNLNSYIAPSLVAITSHCPGKVMATNLREDKEPSLSGDKEPILSKDKEPSLSRNQEPSLSGDKEPSLSRNKESCLSEEKEPSLSEDKEPSLSRNQEPSLSGDEEPSLSGDKEPSLSGDKEPSLSRNKEPCLSEDKEPSLSEDKEPSLNQDKEPSLSENEDTRLSSDEEPSLSKDLALTVTFDAPPDDDLLYGQRTRKPAPLSVLSNVEFQTSPRTLSAFTSENLDSYLESVDNRKIVLSSAVSESYVSLTDCSLTLLNSSNKIPVRSVTTPSTCSSVATHQRSKETTKTPITTPMDTSQKEHIELDGEGSYSPVNPDFDDVDGMLFVSFRCKDSMSAHINIEHQNNWDDNNFHFLDICKFHTASKIKKELGISGKLPKNYRDIRDKEVNFRGIHMKWFKYLRLFRREMQKIKSGEKTVFKQRSIRVQKEPIDLPENVVEMEGGDVLNDTLPLQQSGKLHWRTEQRLLKSLAPWDIKHMGLELKKKRRKNLIFTHRKGSSTKFEGGRIGRFGRIQRSRFDQDNEYYYGDEAKYYEDDHDAKRKNSPEKRPADDFNTQTVIPKKFSLKKQLMKKYNLCGLKKLRKMWKVRVREGRRRLVQERDERKTDTGEFPVLTETMALQALTALEVTGCRPLPMRGEKEVHGGDGEDMELGAKDEQTLCDKPGCRYGCVCHLFSDRSVAGGKSSDSDEITGVVPAKKCEKEYCRLGCICSSLERPEVEKDKHCGKPDCMFGCRCQDIPAISMTPNDLSQNSSSSDELPQLQAVTETSLSPASSDSAKEPVPCTSSVVKTARKISPIPARRIGSQRVAKNLDAITRKALMYMDPEDVFPKPKRRRDRKSDQVPVINKMVPSGSLYSKMENYEDLLPDDDDIEMDYLYNTCARTTPISFTNLSRLSDQTRAKPPKGGNQPKSVQSIKLPSSSQLAQRPQAHEVPVISISDDETDGGSLQTSSIPSLTQSIVNDTSRNQKPKQRKRKQRIEKTLSDTETTPVKYKTKIVNEVVTKPASPPPVMANVIPTVTEYWSKNMVCLKPDNNSQDYPHLLEIMCNCNWESSRRRVLSKISRSLVSSKYPQPMEFSIEEFTISILPKASKPAKIPPNLQSSFPPVMFPVRVTISPSWFNKKEKGAAGKNTTPPQISPPGQMTASKQLRLSKDNKEEIPSFVIVDDDAVSKSQPVKEKISSTWPQSSGISGLSNLCINKSVPTSAAQSNVKENISTFRLREGQVLFSSSRNSQTSQAELTVGKPNVSLPQTVNVPSIPPKALGTKAIDTPVVIYPPSIKTKAKDTYTSVFIPPDANVLGTKARDMPMTTSITTSVASDGKSSVQLVPSSVTSTNSQLISSPLAPSVSTTGTTSTTYSTPKMQLIKNPDGLAKLVPVGSAPNLFQLYPIQPLSVSQASSTSVSSGLSVVQAVKPLQSVAGSSPVPVLQAGKSDLLSFPILYCQRPGQTAITAKPLMFPGQPTTSLIPSSAVPGGQTFVIRPAHPLGTNLPSPMVKITSPHGLLAESPRFTSQSKPISPSPNTAILLPEILGTNSSTPSSQTIPGKETTTTTSVTKEHKYEATTTTTQLQSEEINHTTNTPAQTDNKTAENSALQRPDNQESESETNGTSQLEESTKDNQTAALSPPASGKSEECPTKLQEKDKHLVIVLSAESDSEESEKLGLPESENNKTVNCSVLPTRQEITKSEKSEEVLEVFAEDKMKNIDTANDERKSRNSPALATLEHRKSEERSPLLMKELIRKVGSKSIVEVQEISDLESSLGSWSDLSEETSSQSDKCVVIGSSSEEESNAQPEEYVDVEGFSDFEIEAQKHRSKRKSAVACSNSPYMEMTFTESLVVNKKAAIKPDTGSRPQTFRKMHTHRERQRRSDLASHFRHLSNVVIGTTDHVAKIHILDQAIQTINSLHRQASHMETIVVQQRKRQNFLQSRICTLSGALAVDEVVKEIKQKKRQPNDRRRKKMVECLTLEDGTSIQILMSDDGNSSSAGASSTQKHQKSCNKETLPSSESLTLEDGTSIQILMSDDGNSYSAGASSTQKSCSKKPLPSSESLTLEDGTSIQILMSDDRNSYSAGASSTQTHQKSRNKRPFPSSESLTLEDGTSIQILRSDDGNSNSTGVNSMQECQKSLDKEPIPSRESLTLEDGTSIQIVMSDDHDVNFSSTRENSTLEHQKSPYKEPSHPSESLNLFEPARDSVTETVTMENQYDSTIEDDSHRVADKPPSAIIDTDDQCEEFDNRNSSDPSPVVDSTNILPDSSLALNPDSLSDPLRETQSVGDVVESDTGPNTDQVPLELHSDGLPVSSHTFEEGESGILEIRPGTSVSQSSLYEAVPPVLTGVPLGCEPTAILHPFDEGSGIVEVKAADLVLDCDSAVPVLDSALPGSIPISFDDHGEGILEITSADGNSAVPVLDSALPGSIPISFDDHGAGILEITSADGNSAVPVLDSALPGSVPISFDDQGAGILEITSADGNSAIPVLDSALPGSVPISFDDHGAGIMEIKPGGSVVFESGQSGDSNFIISDVCSLSDLYTT